MPDRFEILSSIESVFLGIQNKINALRNGSVIRSIFYSISVALEDIYNSIEEVKNNSYIHTATGDYLDQLIYGLSKIERIRGRRAFGYVTLTPVGFSIQKTEFADSIAKITFSRLDLQNNILYVPPLASTIKVSTTNGIFDYALLPPIKLLQAVDESFFEPNPDTGNQKIAELIANYAKATIQQNPNAYLKYLIFPLISIETGQDKNLNSGVINTFITAGSFKFLVENNFDYILSNVPSNKEIILDIDSVSQINDEMLTLGYVSEITGGTDEESDESYRQRYWNFLGSLTKGTLDAIKTKVYTLLPNSDIQVYATNNPGILDLYITSSGSISNFLPILLHQLDDVKPAGTIVNVRIAKNNLFNVLIDINDTLSNSEINRIKQYIGDSLNKLSIGEELNYSKIWQLVSNDFNVSNLYFGFSLTPELFDLYKNTYKQFICMAYYNDSVPNQLSEIPSKCSDPDQYFTYSEYLDFVNQGKFAVYIYSYNGYNSYNRYVSFLTRFSFSNNALKLQAPRYQEKYIVEKILNGIYGDILGDPTRTYYSGTSGLINAINTKCKNKSTDLCLRELSLSLVNDSSNSLNSFTRIGLSIKAIESIDLVEANYLKIKLLTLPIPSSNDIELCESLINDETFCASNSYEVKLLYTLLNDVQYIQYKDLDSFSKEKEVCRISYSNIINKDFASKYNIGVRRK